MPTAAALNPASSHDTVTPSMGSKLSPAFRVEFRRRHDESAPIEIAVLHARTIASARHAARLAYPETVILSVTRA